MRLLKTSEDFMRLLKTSEDFMRLPRNSEDFRKFPKISWDSRRLHETSEDFRGLPKISWDSRRLHETSEDFPRFHETPEDFMRLQNWSQSTRSSPSWEGSSRHFGFEVFRSPLFPPRPIVKLDQSWPSRMHWNRFNYNFYFFLLVAFLFFLPRNKGVVYNILIWLFLFVGVGLQSCFYFMEAYARKSCPENVNLIFDLEKYINVFCFSFRIQFGIKSYLDHLLVEFHYHQANF